MNRGRSLTKIFFVTAIMVLCLHTNGFSQEKVLTKEEGGEMKSMMNPTNKTNGPARFVLEGVPRIGYDISFCPFPASLRACMEFMGENYSYEYIMGASGAALMRKMTG